MTGTPRLKILLKRFEKRVRLKLPVIYDKIVKYDLSI